MAQAINRIGTLDVAADRRDKRNYLKFMWFPVALLLALSAGGLTGVLGSYYLNNSRYSTIVPATYSLVTLKAVPFDSSKRLPSRL